MKSIDIYISVSFGLSLLALIWTELRKIRKEMVKFNAEG